jgi:hypothetical protein
MSPSVATFQRVRQVLVLAGFAAVKHVSENLYLDAVGIFFKRSNEVRKARDLLVDSKEGALVTIEDLQFLRLRSLVGAERIAGCDKCSAWAKHTESFRNRGGNIALVMERRVAEHGCRHSFRF